MSDVPSRTEIERLLQLHAYRVHRGPIWSDPNAVRRLRSKIDAMQPKHRVIVRCGEPAELTAPELAEAIGEIVVGGVTVRRYRNGISIESSRAIQGERVDLCRSIAADLKRIVDQKCPVCQSLMLQIKGCEDVPSWAVSCRECVNVLPGPNV